MTQGGHGPLHDRNKQLYNVDCDILEKRTLSPIDSQTGIHYLNIIYYFTLAHRNCSWHMMYRREEHHRQSLPTKNNFGDIRAVFQRSSSQKCGSVLATTACGHFSSSTWWRQSQPVASVSRTRMRALSMERTPAAYGAHRFSGELLQTVFSDNTGVY